MGLVTSNVTENEILKADDVNVGFNAAIDNITKSLQTILDVNNDFIVGDNELLTYHSMSENDWTLNLSPLFGICKSTGIGFVENTVTTIAVNQPNGHARRDIIEICGTYETDDPQQRVFIDFDTRATTIIRTNTKKNLIVKAQCKENDIEGSIQAPEHTAGWVKIAEIYIPDDATKISDCTIYNITSSVAGENNVNWEEEVNATYNLGFLSNVNARLLKEHNTDGSHKDKVIKNSNLNIGIEETQLNGNVLPTGENITINGEVQAATLSITSLLKIFATKVTDIFNEYLKYGAFNFKGELGISDVIENNALVNAIKIGAAGDGSAYIKIADKELFKITQSGNNYVISAGNGYTSSSDYDFVVRKDVVNAIVKDEKPTENSQNLVTSGGVFTAIKSVDDKLSDYIPKTDIEQTITESETNVPSSKAVISKLEGYTKKWIGTQAQYDELEEKDLDTFYCITDGINPLIDDKSIAEDTTYSSKKIEESMEDIQKKLVFDDTPTEGSSNPVTSDGIKKSLGKLVWHGTKAEYDALAEKDSATTYVVTDEDTDIDSIINDLIVSTVKTWSSSKIQETLTNALAEKTEIGLVKYLSGGTDFNTLIPSDNTYAKYFVYGDESNTNVPSGFETRNFIVETIIAGSSAMRVKQIAHYCEDLDISFTRVRTSAGTWSTWERVTTASVLNSALGNYVDKTKFINKELTLSYNNDYGYTLTPSQLGLSTFSNTIITVEAVLYNVMADIGTKNNTSITVRAWNLNSISNGTVSLSSASTLAVRVNAINFA